MTLSFSELALHPSLLTAVAAEGYTHPTPIQAQAIPAVLDGRDVLGIAQTGTGKTAAFSLPMLHRLHAAGRRPAPKSARALVLTPTRELAIQIDEQVAAYSREHRCAHTVIFGGVNQNKQVRALSRGVDVLVATPGRLLDLMGQGHVRLDSVEILVLDEADRMLDMGFVRDVRKIVEVTPKKRQTLLFSATMPSSIAELSKTILRKPVRVEVTPASTTVERIDQRVMMVAKSDKAKLLALVLGRPDLDRVLVFTRTKHGANRLVQKLDRDRIEARAIHGNKSQAARQKALAAFRDGDVSVLVATDIAARGIDVDGISHVINYDLPNEPESYVHRIGRTARAGADGVAISFCDAEERTYLRDIERLTGEPLTRVEGHRYEDRSQPAAPPKPSRSRNRSRGRGRGGRGRGRGQAQA